MCEIIIYTFILQDDLFAYKILGSCFLYLSIFYLLAHWILVWKISVEKFERSWISFAFHKCHGIYARLLTLNVQYYLLRSLGQVSMTQDIHFFCCAKSPCLMRFWWQNAHCQKPSVPIILIVQYNGVKYLHIIVLLLPASLTRTFPVSQLKFHFHYTSPHSLFPSALPVHALTILSVPITLTH